MANETKLATGIDRLVQIIRERRKVSVSEAAKELGVSIALIEEWANFLEEENIIDFEYKLSGTILVERKITDKDVMKKEKVLDKKKQVFKRDVQTSVKNLKEHSVKISKLKDQYKKFINRIGGDFNTIKVDVDLLHKLEESHDNLTKEISEQEFYFKSRIKQINNNLEKESRKYNAILSAIEKRNLEIEKKEKEIKRLDEHQEVVQNNLKKMQRAAEEISKSIRKKDQEIVNELADTKMLKKQIKLLQEEVSEQKKMMDDLFKDKIVKEREITGVLNNIKKKMRDKRKDIEKGQKDVKKIEEDLADFISRKQDMKNLLADTDMDTRTLQEEMESVIAEARRLDMLTKSSDISEFSKQIKKQYNKLKGERDKVHKDYGSLTKLLRFKK